VSKHQLLDRTTGDGGPPVVDPPPKAVKIRVTGRTF